MRLGKGTLGWAVLFLKGGPSNYEETLVKGPTYVVPIKKKENVISKSWF